MKFRYPLLRYIKHLRQCFIGYPREIPWTSSKIRCTSYFQLCSRCVEISMKYFSSHAPLRNLEFYLLSDSSTSIVFRARAIVSVVYSIVFDSRPILLSLTRGAWRLKHCLECLIHNMTWWRIKSTCGVISVLTKEMKNTYLFLLLTHYCETSKLVSSMTSSVERRL